MHGDGAGSAAAGALVRGITPADLDARRTIPASIVSGSLDDFAESPSIVVGARLARKLNVAVGDRMTLISPSSTPTAFGSVPRMRAFKIIALFDVGMYEYDSTFVFMPLGQAQLFFGGGDTVNAIEILVEDPNRVEAVRAPLAEAIGAGRYSVDWKQRNSSFFNALMVERNVMFLILTLIILVAAFNIISSMIMLVNDKRASIAIMRTMGATQGMITRIFFMSGASVGVIGTVGGIAARAGVLPQHRDDSAMAAIPVRHRVVFCRDLLFVEIACRDRPGRGDLCHLHGPVPVFRRLGLPVLASLENRSGGGPALWLMPVGLMTAIHPRRNPTPDRRPSNLTGLKNATVMLAAA